MRPITKLQELIESIIPEGMLNNFGEISGDVLKIIVDKLPEFDEFKNVKKNQHSPYPNL